MTVSTVQLLGDERQCVDPEVERGEDVLALLGDRDCRCILSRVKEGPKTASELAAICEVPQSTLYRKLDRLALAGLLEEGLRLDPSGKHATEYVAAVDDVVVSIEEGCSIRVRLDPLVTA